MGFFSKRKRTILLPGPTPGPRSSQNRAQGMSDELVAVLTAAVAAADSSQLVAVLTAAVHAYRDSEAGSELTIRKIDRRAGVRPAWAVAGNRESIETRRF